MDKKQKIETDEKKLAVENRDDLEKTIDNFFEKGFVDENLEPKEEKQGDKQENKILKKEEESKIEKKIKENENEINDVEVKIEKKDDVEEDKELKLKENQQEDKQDEILKKYNLTKFKTVDDALKSYQELERAYSKTQQLLSSYQKGVIPEEVKEGVEGALNIIKQPRIDINPPSPQDYVVDGEFDIASYIRDILTDYTLSLQKSLTFGSLASAIYTLQKSALTSSYSQLKKEEEADRQASEIRDAIYENFPIVKKDKNIERKISRAIIGEAQIKKQPLTKDEILSITADIVNGIKIENEKKDDDRQIEQLKSSPQIIENKETTGKANKIEEAVLDIYNSYQQKKSSIF